MIQSLDRLYRRIMSMMGIGKITLTNDAKNNQYIQVQMLPNQVQELRVAGMYGHASVAPTDSDAIVIFIAGDRQNGIVIGTVNQAARMKNLAEGESALYDDIGQYVHLTKAGIVINGGGLPVTINNTPLVTMDSNLIVTGTIADLNAVNGTLGDLRDAHNDHHHAVENISTGISTVTSDTPDLTV